MKINEIIVDPTQVTFEVIKEPKLAARILRLHTMLSTKTNNFFYAPDLLSYETRSSFLYDLLNDRKIAANTLGTNSQTYALIIEMIEYLDTSPF